MTAKDKPTERKITLSEYEHCSWDGERFNYEPRGRKGLREAGATDEQINAAVGYLATWAMHDGGAFHRFPIERVADGLTLHVSSETHNGREFGARFSLGNYRDARGEVITIRVGGNSIEPAARVNLEKRDPAAVAKDIIRRVIKPGEDVLVSIRLRQENVAKAVAERDVLLAKLAALPGVEVRPHWSGGKSHHILAGPLTATLSDYGGFSVDRVSGLSSHADIIELCKMLGEFGRR